MRLPQWTFERQQEMLPFEEIRFLETVLAFEESWRLEPLFVGIDPGQVNMGITVLSRRKAYLYEVTLPASRNAIERIYYTTHAVQHLLQPFQLKPIAACIEGAAYLAIQGQVPLAENRTAAAITLMASGVATVEIVPPKTIREKVFRNGRFRAQEVWPDLPPNSGTALGCAFYATGIFGRKENRDP